MVLRMNVDFEKDLFPNQYKIKESFLLFHMDHKIIVSRKDLLPFIWECYLYEVKKINC